jgi:hypothetical protein
MRHQKISSAPNSFSQLAFDWLESNLGLEVVSSSKWSMTSVLCRCALIFPSGLCRLLAKREK